MIEKMIVDLFQFNHCCPKNIWHLLKSVTKLELGNGTEQLKRME
jgi:hypothetical protein